MKQAGTAALVTAILCLPRLMIWTDRPAQLWVLWLILLWGLFFLWDFVFAWQEKYAGRPVFAEKVTRNDWLLAVGSGLLLGILLAWLVDPARRLSSPEEYPQDFSQWFAMTLFFVCFESVYLCFAPFALVVRLSGSWKWAATFTVCFSVFVMLLKMASKEEPTPLDLALLLGVFRVSGAGVALWLFLRAGVLPVAVFLLVLQARLLLGLV